MFPDHDSSSPPAAPYSVDLVASLTGVSSQTILRYHEEGLLSPLPGSAPEAPQFDDDTLRTLRRIEYLRTSCEASSSALKLILRLLEEIEDLRSRLTVRR